MTIAIVVAGSYVAIAVVVAGSCLNVINTINVVLVSPTNYRRNCCC